MSRSGSCYPLLIGRRRKMESDFLALIAFTIPLSPWFSLDLDFFGDETDLLRSPQFPIGESFAIF